MFFFFCVHLSIVTFCRIDTPDVSDNNHFENSIRTEINSYFFENIIFAAGLAAFCTRFLYTRTQNVSQTVLNIPGYYVFYFFLNTNIEI